MYKAPTTLRLLTTTLIGASLAAAAYAPARTNRPPVARAVGVVVAIHGKWTDATHKISLEKGATVLDGAYVIREEPFEPEASIEIYLLDGSLKRQRCVVGACSVPMVLHLVPSERERPEGALARIKNLLWPSDAQPIGAVTFGDTRLRSESANRPLNIHLVATLDFQPITDEFPHD